MIRDYKAEDLNAIMTLWLETNIAAHPFIDPNYWYEHAPIVRKVLPTATLVVHVNDYDEIDGFIGLERNHIEGIFVKATVQKNGIGSTLINYVKAQHSSLTLSVFSENTCALEFYKHHGFTILDEHFDTATRSHELNMRWSR